MAEPPPTPCEDPPELPGDPEFAGKSPNLPDSPQKRPRGRAPAHTLLRNRRYAALRELLRGGEYFSERRMRLRAPALFRHYLGSFREPQIPRSHPKSAAAPRSLRQLLLGALESADEDDEDEEEEEEEEDEDDEDEDEERVPDAAERELLRLEFTTHMYQRFLDGQDSDFDYSQVDENPELDNLDIVSRDLEDQYFDEEEPSEAPRLE